MHKLDSKSSTVSDEHSNESDNVNFGALTFKANFGLLSVRLRETDRNRNCLEDVFCLGLFSTTIVWSGTIAIGELSGKSSICADEGCPVNLFVNSSKSFMFLKCCCNKSDGSEGNDNLEMKDSR